MKKCPFCAEEIQDEAVVCKHCKRDLPQSKPTPSANQQAGVGCLLLVVAALGFGWWASSDDSPETQRQRSDASARVFTTTLCELTMTERLRSPSSADYPFGHVGNVQSIGTNQYGLRSYVDSQNGFGAMLRTNFLCVVEGQGSEMSGYRVVSLTVE